MPFKLPSLLYVVIGLVVVFIQDYLDNCFGHDLEGS